MAPTTRLEVDFDFEYSDFSIKEEFGEKYLQGIKTYDIGEAIQYLENTLEKIKKEVEQ